MDQSPWKSTRFLYYHPKLSILIGSIVSMIKNMSGIELKLETKCFLNALLMWMMLAGRWIRMLFYILLRPIRKFLFKFLRQGEFAFHAFFSLIQFFYFSLLMRKENVCFIEISFKNFDQNHYNNFDQY